MIKKLLIYVFLTNFLCMQTFAQSYSSLDKIENYLFGITYNRENETKRIERLEKNIYGAIQTGSVKNRLEKISKDISGDLIGQEITPSKYTELEEQEDYTVDYPIIDKLEKQIFNKEFKNKKLENRLTELERKVFNKTYENNDLNTRTERLKTAVNIPNQYEYINPSNNLGDFSTFNDYNSMTNKQHNYTSKDNKNIDKILTALEKKIFKKTYLNDSEENRLERLEEKMFNTSFPQDNIESRLERLALAYQATKTSQKYDSNKLSQHMATAMQIGMFLLMILAMVL